MKSGVQTKPLTTRKIVFYHSQDEHRNDHTVFPSRNMNLEFSPQLFAAAGFTENEPALVLDHGSLGPLTLIRIMWAANEPLQPVESAVMLLADGVTNSPKYQQPLQWIGRLKELLANR